MEKKQKHGRKRIKLENIRFGNCVVLERAIYVGNNLQYKCLCDCGETFTTSAQQLRVGLITACPHCRKRKRRQVRDALTIQKMQNFDMNATKYTLMNSKKTQIIKGCNGIHSYFSKIKARIAASTMGDAVVVPLEEALEATK